MALKKRVLTPGSANVDTYGNEVGGETSLRKTQVHMEEHCQNGHVSPEHQGGMGHRREKCLCKTRYPAQGDSGGM